MLDVHAVPDPDIELNAEHLDDFDEESCGLEGTPTEVELMVMLSGMVPTGRFG
jgi:hypothetical protein